MSARTEPGLCNEPGPDDLHCTEDRGHRYSCYDAQDDTSWNDGQFADGWYDERPHRCEDPACAGRPEVTRG